jgi:type VI secretion system protein ImpL
VSDWLLQFNAIWVWVLIGLVLVIVFVLVVLSTVVRRSSAADESHPGAPPEEPEGAAAPSAEAAPAEAASTSFSRAIRFLRSSISGRDFRYQLPWCLVIGDPGAGKSELMRAVGADLASAESSSRRRGLEWRFLDRGILIGVPGRYFKAGSSREEHDWSKLLKQLQNNRPRRPLDGVVLAVPATDLIGPDALDETQLSARAGRFSDMLAQAQRVLGFLFPVYLIVTKCDRIEGFDAFCRELPSKSRDDIFGWSSPYQLDASFTPEWVEEAFNTTSQELQRLQSEIFVECSELPNPDEVFLFPEEFARLRIPLGVYLDRLFRETAYRESFRFRGLYFCGDFSQYAAPAQEPPAQVDAVAEPWMAAIAPATPPPATFSVRRTPAFLKRLFEEKIFSECGVARPLARVFLTKSRTVAYIQTAAAALALILIAGTWFSYQRLAGDRDRLLPALLKMTSLVPPSQTLDQKKSFGLGLLQSMDAAATVNFWSVFQPASWFSPLDDSVTQMMKTACEQWVFSALQADLLDRKTKLLYTAPAAAPKDDQKAADGADSDDGKDEADVPAITSLESAAEYQQLDKFVAGLRAIYEATGIYENLRQQGQMESLDRIRKLLSYLELSDIRPRGHLAVALQTATGPPAPITSADIETASETVRQLVGALLRDWFDNNVAWNDVEQLRQSISDLQRGQSTNYQQLKDLVNLIGQAESDFTDPNFRWLSNTSLELPAALQRVSVNPLAGPQSVQLTGYARQLGEGYLNQLRTNLRDESTALTGPLLEIKNPIGLSSGTKQLEEAVENTVNLPFLATTVEPRAIQITLEPVQRLMWRLDPLHEAVRLTGIYDQFVRDGLRGAPDSLSTALSRLALAHLIRHVQDLIVQAQIIQPRPVAAAGPNAEDETLPEVNAFRDASESLVQLAERYNSLGQTYIYNALMRVMVVQTFNLLTKLDGRLNEEQAYAIKEGAWTGKGSMALAVFDVPAPPALADYLTAQRDRIRFFEQQAQSVVPFLVQYMPVRAAAQNQLIAKWQRLIDDFRQYEAKRPGATLAALEDFVTTGVDKIPERACHAEGPPDQRPDYFVQIRNGLETRLSDRCRDVSAIAVCAAYTKIADQFNDTLAGKFPFAALAAGKTQPEAVPEDVTAFYKLLDANGKTARAALDDDTRFGDAGSQARQFLDGIEKLRPLVVPSSPETEKEPPLTLDLVPQFRVNRSNESGGSQIIDWTMQVGGQIFQQKDPEHPGRWRAGNPVRLSLRWANDSVYVPAADASQPDLVIRDRNAYFELTSRWSLLAFLRRHEALPSDLPQSGDPQPYTLKFRVRTALDPKWPVSDSNPAPSPAVVFLHLRIMPAGGKNPIAIPPVPASAPGLGPSCAPANRYISDAR